MDRHGRLKRLEHHARTDAAQDPHLRWIGSGAPPATGPRYAQDLVWQDDGPPYVPECTVHYDYAADGSVTTRTVQGGGQ